MTFGDLLQSLKTSRDPIVRELLEAVNGNLVAPVGQGPGRQSAGGAAAMLAIRGQTTAEAGIVTAGFQSTLESLALLDDGDPVALFHFSGPERLFSVFVREGDESTIGCIRVNRRRKETPTETLDE